MTPPSLYADKKSGPWILAAAKILFGTMAISLKLVATPVVILVLAMHFFGAVGSLPKAWGDLKQLSWKMMIKISALGLAVVSTDLTFFYAVRLTDASVATLIRWTAPIMLAAILFLYTKQNSVRRAAALDTSLVRRIGMVAGDSSLRDNLWFGR